MTVSLKHISGHMWGQKYEIRIPKPKTLEFAEMVEDLDQEGDSVVIKYNYSKEVARKAYRSFCKYNKTTPVSFDEIQRVASVAIKLFDDLQTFESDEVYDPVVRDMVLRKRTLEETLRMKSAFRGVVDNYIDLLISSSLREEFEKEWGSDESVNANEVVATEETLTT